MNRDISSMPPWLSAIAYGILAVGFIAAWGFVIRYTSLAPWYTTAIGQHFVSMTSSVGAFFGLYLILALYPDFPGRGAIRFVLLIAIVANCVWRWALFEIDERRMRRGTLPPRYTPDMTHERTPNDEHPDGPEHDESLPDAASIPVFDGPHESDAPPLPDDREER